MEEEREGRRRKKNEVRVEKEEKCFKMDGLAES